MSQLMRTRGTSRAEHAGRLSPEEVETWSARLFAERDESPGVITPALRHVLVMADTRLLATAIFLLPKELPDDGAVVSAVRRALRSRYSDARSAAAEVAARWRVRGCCASLQLLLEDSHELTRVNASEAIAQLRCRRAIPDLARALESDPSGLARGYMARAYAYLTGEAAVSLLEAQLCRERSPWTKTSLMLDLYDLGRRDYLTEILRRLRSRNGRIRWLLAHNLPALLIPDHYKQGLDAINAAIAREPYEALAEQLRSAAAALSRPSTGAQ